MYLLRRTMKKLILTLTLIFIASFAQAQCVGEILDVEHAVTNSGSQFKFITQYTCKDQIVDVHGQPCDNCEQGNRVGGDKTIAEAKAEAKAEISVHAKNLNGRFGGNALKIKYAKQRLYAPTEGIEVDGKTDVEITVALKTKRDADRVTMLQAKQKNVNDNIAELRTQTVGYKKSESEYVETYMGKTIKADTSEKVTVTNVAVVE